MRLIDADELENVPIFKEIIKSRPTAYSVDKVVKELEEIEAKYSELSCSVNDITIMREYTAKEQTMALAIEIVKKQLGAE